MSRLRAKCPDCQTFTAVAMGPDYQCHSCGREFAAGLVRVPRAWGNGGEDMAEAARLPLGYPEALVVEEDTLDEQNLSLAAGIPIIAATCRVPPLRAAPSFRSRSTGGCSAPTSAASARPSRNTCSSAA